MNVLEEHTPEEKKEIQQRFRAIKCAVCNTFGTLRYGSIRCHACNGRGYVIIDNETGKVVDDGGNII